MTNHYLSQKIKFLSGILICLVVLIHSQLFDFASGINLILQRIFSQEIAKISVPLFFALSGFLFFKDYYKQNFHWFLLKIKTRITSLVVPYVFWSIFGFLTVVILQYINQATFSVYGKVSNYSHLEIIKSILWTPIGTYQLWFIRDLFIVMLISPIIAWLINNAKELFLFAVGILWIMGWQYLISIESLFFFSLGAYFSIVRNNLVSIKIHNSLASVFFLVIWLAICIVNKIYINNYILHCSGILFGIISIWFLYDVLYEQLPVTKLNNTVFSFTFFIYVFHEPVLTIIKGIGLTFMKSQLQIFILYLISGAIAIAFSYFIGKYVRKSLPHTYKLITGRR